MKIRIVLTIIFVVLMCIGCTGINGVSNSPKSNPTEAPATPTTPPTPTEIPKVATPIFYLDLVENDLELNGQLVEVIVPINRVYSKNHIRAEDELEYCLNIYVNRELTEKEKSYKFVKVKGIVDSTASGNYWDMHGVKECEIIEFYDEAPDSYAEQLAQYKLNLEEKLAQEKEATRLARIEARDKFIEIARDDVSYEDLRRYPDTYKDKELKLKIKVTEVEPDTWLSNGSIYAQYEGELIIVHDEREVREPRLIEGDVITIYAKGEGLTKITEYIKGSGILGSLLGAKVTDEYEVPAVELQYTSEDNLDSF